MRILAATNRSLEAEVAAGRFLEDLYYELNVIEVTLPPLRDAGRHPALSGAPTTVLHLREGKPLSGFAHRRDALLRYAWPGNIRELRNTVERGGILAAGPEVALDDLFSQVTSPRHAGITPAALPRAADEPLTLEQIEAEHIRRVLDSTTSIGEAAAKLGINPSTLYRKRKRYGI